MLTHPPTPVAAGDDTEPEPQHERDTSNPDSMPELPRRLPQTATGTASPTPTVDAHRRLGQHLLDAVRAQDERIPAERRSPRTVAEMRARLANREAI
ncbi:hypothetical protein [Streptomyces spirodelae]|uniref:Uncharacterized protein n=1 Tax=Streptomyces spirodelae TaxID=2812904 RepID=A0ABS3X1F4_9ACTN|nr:hypothetical protein [Streptomyces spirodelae]MBO8189210.1 hypothetical protein [Streptomyces spirodelae]